MRQTKQLDPAAVPLGEADNGPVGWRPQTAGKLLISGPPGSGKTAVLEAIQAHVARRPRDWRVLYAETAETAGRVLEEVLEEMHRRWDLLEYTGIENLSELNEVRAGRGEEPLQRMAVMVDEIAGILYADPGLQRLLVTATGLGRTAGVHMILATQRPDLLGGVERNCAATLTMHPYSGGLRGTYRDGSGEREIRIFPEAS